MIDSSKFLDVRLIFLQVTISMISVVGNESADHRDIRKFLFERNYEVVSIDPHEEFFVKKLLTSSNHSTLM